MTTFLQQGISEAEDNCKVDDIWGVYFADYFKKFFYRDTKTRYIMRCIRLTACVVFDPILV